jgi:hypothetical protein
MDGHNMPNMNMIKGLIATLLGIILIFYSYHIIVHALLFVSGFLFVFYGLRLLDIPAVNRVLDHVRTFFKKIC